MAARFVTPRGRTQLRTYRVVVDGRSREVETTSPEAAVRRAFRAPAMWRWELIGDETRASALIYLDRTLVGIANLFDNG